MTIRKKEMSNINQYLETFLPVSAFELKNCAETFYDGIKQNHLIEISEIIKKCRDFEPRTLFRIFLQKLIEAQKNPVSEDNTCGWNAEVEIKNIRAIRECFNNVSVYNQKPIAALEKLYRDLAAIRKSHFQR